MERGADAEFAIRSAGTAVFLVSALLLTSIGGAGIVASPVTLPLMYLLARSHPSPSFLGAGLLIGTLTAFIGGWGLGYVVLGRGSGSVLTGFLASAAAGTAFAAIPWSRATAAERPR